MHANAIHDQTVAADSIPVCFLHTKPKIKYSLFLIGTKALDATFSQKVLEVSEALVTVVSFHSMGSIEFICNSGLSSV